MKLLKTKVINLSLKNLVCHILLLFLFISIEVNSLSNKNKHKSLSKYKRKYASSKNTPSKAINNSESITNFIEMKNSIAMQNCLRMLNNNRSKFKNKNRNRNKMKHNDGPGYRGAFENLKVRYTLERPGPSGIAYPNIEVEKPRKGSDGRICSYSENRRSEFGGFSGYFSPSGGQGDDGCCGGFSGNVNDHKNNIGFDGAAWRLAGGGAKGLNCFSAGIPLSTKPGGGPHRTPDINPW